MSFQRWMYSEVISWHQSARPLFQELYQAQPLLTLAWRPCPLRILPQFSVSRAIPVVPQLLSCAKNASATAGSIP